MKRNSGSLYILYKMNVRCTYVPCKHILQYKLLSIRSQYLFSFSQVVHDCSDRWERNFIFYKTPQERVGGGFRFRDKGDQKLNAPPGQTIVQATACSRAFLVCVYVVTVFNEEKHFLCVQTTLGITSNCNIFSLTQHPLVGLGYLIMEP